MPGNVEGLLAERIARKEQLCVRWSQRRSKHPVQGLDEVRALLRTQVDDISVSAGR